MGLSIYKNNCVSKKLFFELRKEIHLFHASLLGIYFRIYHKAKNQKLPSSFFSLVEMIATCNENLQDFWKVMKKQFTSYQTTRESLIRLLKSYKEDLMKPLIWMH